MSKALSIVVSATHAVFLFCFYSHPGVDLCEDKAGGNKYLTMELMAPAQAVPSLRSKEDLSLAKSSLWRSGHCHGRGLLLCDFWGLNKDKFTRAGLELATS